MIVSKLNFLWKPKWPDNMSGHPRICSDNARFWPDIVRWPAVTSSPDVPEEIANNDYARFWEVKELYYGICASREYDFYQLRETVKINREAYLLLNNKLQLKVIVHKIFFWFTFTNEGLTLKQWYENENEVLFCMSCMYTQVQSRNFM